MPLYEYYCSDCKSKFELLVSHQHADDIVCMKCRSEKVRRLLSTFALPRGGGEDTSYDDVVPSMGGCGCGGGSCGCN
jgi:putative FmdB family regulatory protein